MFRFPPLKSAWTVLYISLNEIYQVSHRVRSHEEIVDLIAKEDHARGTNRTELHRRLSYDSGFCDGQCGNYYSFGGDYLSDDVNDLCIYCFDYTKTLEAINFNYNPG